MFDYRKDHRAIRSKAALKEALFELLEESEWDKISVQDITRRAKLNRTTFYQHYEDKFDLLNQTVDEMIDSLKNELEKTDKSVEAESGPSAPLRILLTFYKHLEKHSRRFAILLRKRFEIPVKDRLEAFVEERFQCALPHMIKDGRDNAVPRELMFITFASTQVSAAVWWLDQGMPYPPEFMAEKINGLMRS